MGAHSWTCRSNGSLWMGGGRWRRPRARCRDRAILDSGSGVTRVVDTVRGVHAMIPEGLFTSELRGRIAGVWSQGPGFVDRVWGSSLWCAAPRPRCGRGGCRLVARPNERGQAAGSSGAAWREDRQGAGGARPHGSRWSPTARPCSKASASASASASSWWSRWRVATAVGWAIDHWLGTRPWGIIVLFFLGVAAGMLNVYRAVTGISTAAGYRRPDEAPAARAQAERQVGRRRELTWR